jgi:hypothetical protein
MNRPFLLSGIFILGCATGGVASQLVVPQAQAGTTPARWEHWCSSGKGNTKDLLKKSGEAGWEMVAAFATRVDRQSHEAMDIEDYAFCFKRVVPAITR